MNFTQSDVPSLEAAGSEVSGPLAEKKQSWMQGTISPHDSRFLSGLVQAIDPARSVEIGVASGWSSAVLLSSLARSDGERDPAKKVWLEAVDLSPDLYTDKSIRTGAAVDAIVPELTGNYKLTTGKYSFQAMPEIGEVDFAFIDAHHGHPWAALDLVAVLPFIKKDSWVAFHDLNLCGFERHNHGNRAPYYMYYLWPGERINSTQRPTMIGAIKLTGEPRDHFDTIIEILCTPWEVALPHKMVEYWVAFVREHLGDEEADKFANACTLANPATS